MLGLLMRQAPVPIRESIVTTAISTLYFPAQRIVSAVGHYKSIALENEQLKEENARLRQETYHAREGLQELARLHTLVRFDDKWDYPIVTSRVVGHNPGRFLTTMVINRGTEHGVHENMPVFSMNGLVGKVSKATLNHSRVQLLVDPNLKLSVMDRKTRVVGFLESMDGVRLTAMVPTHAGIRAGDTLITSGLGGIFPKGIPVGTVKDIRKSDLDVMRQMDVEPFQDFTTLEEVFVMEKEPDWIVKELLDE
ncbi:MAG: rod shape-determining protein MreC [Fibrobacter sp.]|uniref:rod shape-determining protein MreC n=1 Tax=Fibrobacter sp. TaxID=35828 RepID=UPI002A91F070|nr:rod shape-determining protein MreC [Fibrobacter sp.]MDY6265312.1 rod shape-determining protein MreC [Fibrobacter sp.]